MTHAFFLASLKQDPWYVSETHHQILLAMTERLSEDPMAFISDPEVAETDPADRLMTVEDGIATINIEGPLSQNVHPILKSLFGVTDFADIRASVAKAATDSSIGGVLLNMDTPGGTVRGTPETSADLFALRSVKPVYAYTQGMMASAGYYLGSQATAIYATPSSTVGSIGVMMPFVDQSKAAEDAGLKVEVFKSGTFKGAGYPGTSLTEPQRENIQESIDEMFGDFKTAISRGGRHIDDSAMRGQSFSGSKALGERLVTDLVSNRKEATDRLRQLVSLRQS